VNPRGGHDHVAFGVFDAPPQIPGGTDVQCPTCGLHSPPQWRSYETGLGGYVSSLRSGKDETEGDVALEWMRCANEDCEELIVRVHEQSVVERLLGGVPLMRTDTWTARPRFGESQRPIDPLVPDPFKTDYAEATAILDISPRMSAVLSRSLLADLLKTYAGKEQFNLQDRIDAFIADRQHPRYVRDNLHHLREIANFSAHTQTNDQAIILEIGRDEAEWTLDVIDRLYDYFIISPERDRKMQKQMDERLKEAGRNPIKPLPDDPAHEQ